MKNPNDLEGTKCEDVMAEPCSKKHDDLKKYVFSSEKVRPTAGIFHQCRALHPGSREPAPPGTGITKSFREWVGATRPAGGWGW